MAASDSSPKEKLIALEGCSGPELQVAAQRLKDHYCCRTGGGISTWDASGIFYELGGNDWREQRPSPRTLILLYAADLSFRLQWEIRPALKEGECVVAAPYIESIIALGRAVDLPLRWLKALFRFAPQPAVTYRIHEPLQPPKKIKPTDGYAEFCGLVLKESSPAWNPADLGRKMIAFLAEEEAHHSFRTIPLRLPADPFSR